MEQKPTYTKKEAGKAIGVDRRTIHNWIDTGQIHQADGRIPHSEVVRLTQVPLPEHWRRAKGTVTFVDQEGTDVTVSLRRGELFLTTAGGRVKLTRQEAMTLSQVLARYATSGRIPTHDR